MQGRHELRILQVLDAGETRHQIEFGGLFAIRFHDHIGRQEDGRFIVGFDGPAIGCVELEAAREALGTQGVARHRDCEEQCQGGSHVGIS